MERSRTPQLGVVHLDAIDASNFNDFEDSLRADDLDLRIESRPDPGPYAGVEWLIPTVVFVYIGKSYFEAFLKEAGKDHYQLLKGAISRLSAKFFGNGKPHGRVIFSKGKAESADSRYSLFYSVVADLGDSLRVKLLIQSDFGQEACAEAQDAFLEFMAAVYNGTLDIDAVKGLREAKPLGHTLLVAYNPETSALEVIDPLAGRRGVGA